jgi:hypothetical protein
MGSDRGVGCRAGGRRCEGAIAQGVATLMRGQQITRVAGEIILLCAKRQAEIEVEERAGRKHFAVCGRVRVPATTMGAAVCTLLRSAPKRRTLPPSKIPQRRM